MLRRRGPKRFLRAQTVSRLEQCLEDACVQRRMAGQPVEKGYEHPACRGRFGALMSLALGRSRRLMAL